LCLFGPDDEMLWEPLLVLLAGRECRCCRRIFFIFSLLIRSPWRRRDEGKLKERRHGVYWRAGRGARGEQTRKKRVMRVPPGRIPRLFVFSFRHLTTILSSSTISFSKFFCFFLLVFVSVFSHIYFWRSLPSTMLFVLVPRYF